MLCWEVNSPVSTDDGLWSSHEVWRQVVSAPDVFILSLVYHIISWSIWFRRPCFTSVIDITQDGFTPGWVLSYLWCYRCLGIFVLSKILANLYCPHIQQILSNFTTFNLSQTNTKILNRLNNDVKEGRTHCADGFGITPCFEPGVGENH